MNESNKTVSILNFSHPVTDQQRIQIADLLEYQPEAITVMDIPMQIDLDGSLVAQIASLLDGLEWNSNQWQTEAIIVNLPGLSAAAAVLLAELSGRIGHLPSILWVRRADNALVTQFEVAEIVNLAAVRDDARKTRLG